MLCKHCQTPIAETEEFCCSGCETAYHLLQESSPSPLDYSGFVGQDDQGNFHLTLSIEGVHCASCIQLIENALLAEEDCLAARVNMSTERISITWKTNPEHINKYTNIINRLGYKLKPSHDNKKTTNEEEKSLLRCIAVAGFSAGNLMMISVGLWSSDTNSMGLATRDLFHLISALIAIPAVYYSGRPFFRSALTALRAGHTNMDVPISLAVILATLMSIHEAIVRGAHVYFDSAVMLLFFLLIGRYLDARTRQRARQSAQDLLSMLSGSATIVENGTAKTLPIRDIREGMTLIITAGETIPVDGSIIQGQSDIDMSLVTGETIPQSVNHGDQVFSGTLNLSAPFYMKASKSSDHSLLSHIVKLMENATEGQHRYIRLADRAAKLYTPLIHSIGLLTFLTWWLILDISWQSALLHAITVLIITCPCALGLAVPVVQVIANSALMKRGILVKSGAALEKLATIDTAIFDKTGTLTIGKPALSSTEHTSDDLQLAASLAIHSKHPLSQAICHAYDGPLKTATDVKELPGKGITATIDLKTIRLGSRKWCGGTAEKHAPESLQLWLSTNSNSPVAFYFNDRLRSDAQDTIAYLQRHHISTTLLSGDQHKTVEKTAKEVAITAFHAEISPVEKHNHLKQLHNQRHRTLMVGDGLNDAPSLAAATVSMSPSSALDITQNTADIVFQGEQLSSVTTAWRTACRATQLIKQNFALAVLYNMIAIPLAVSGYVTPLVAAIAMSASSLVVIGNSFRLQLNREA